MQNYPWIQNPNFNELTPEPGDIAILHFNDTFQYSVKTIISTVDPDQITTIVQAIFDRDSDMMINNHDLEDEQVTVRKNYIHKIVKRAI